MSSFDQNPFQRLSAGSAMSRSFSLLFQRVDIYMGTTLFMWLPIVAMAASLVYAIGSSMASSPSVTTTSGAGGAYNKTLADAMLSGFQNFIGQLLAEYVLLIIVSIVGKAAMTYAVAAQYMGRQPSLGESLKQGCARWCDLFCTSISLGLCVFCMHLAVAIFGYVIVNISDKLSFLVVIVQIGYAVFLTWLWVSLIILTPVIIVERKTMLKAVERCWNLANGQRCLLFCTVFVVTIIYYLTQMILAQVLFAFHPDGHGIVLKTPILYAFITSLPALVYVPMISILETVIYFNIRVEQEGLNATVLQEEMGEFAVATKIEHTFDGDDDYAVSKEGAYSDAPTKQELV